MIGYEIVNFIKNNCMKKRLVIVWLSLLSLIFVSEVFSQENAERLRQLQLANQAEAAAKTGSNSAAKIEASKGSNTLPPGVNTTQMVAEQYRTSGALRPYQPVNQANGNADLSVSSPTSTKLVKKAGDPAATTPSDKTQGVKNLKGNNATAALASQLPTNFPPASGTNTGVTNGSTSGAGGSQSGNRYDKVPNLLPANQYSAPTITGANNSTYGSLQKIPQNQTTNSVYGKAPNTGNSLQANSYYSSPTEVRKETQSRGNNQLNASSKPNSIYEQPNSPLGTSTVKLPSAGTNPASTQSQTSNTNLSGKVSTNLPASSGTNGGDLNGATKGTGGNQYDKVPYLLPANQYNAPPRTGANTNPYGSLQKIPQGQASNSVYSTGPTTGNARQNNPSSQSPSATGTNVGTGNQNYVPPASATSNHSNTGGNSGVPASTPNLNKNTSPSNQNPKVETRKKMGTKG
jgi:hypothetical protein